MTDDAVEVIVAQGYREEFGVRGCISHFVLGTGRYRAGTGIFVEEVMFRKKKEGQEMEGPSRKEFPGS